MNTVQTEQNYVYTPLTSKCGIALDPAVNPVVKPRGRGDEPSPSHGLTAESSFCGFDKTPELETCSVYPWLEPSLQYLVRLQAANRLPHALLCTGQEGLGLTSLALAWAQYLLCHTKVFQTNKLGNSPSPIEAIHKNKTTGLTPLSLWERAGERESNGCGKCASCILFTAGNHPDFLRLKSEEKKTIPVDEIRALIDFVTQTPAQSQNKMVLISEAEKLNLSSANALLKVLEEPPPSSKIVLVTSEPYRLPATIKSRCHFLRVLPPSKDVSLPWLLQKSHASEEACLRALAFTQNQPLQALLWLKEDKLSQKNQFLENLFEVSRGQKNPIEFSDALAKKPFPEIIDWLYLLVLDIVRLRLMDHPQLYHHDKLDLIWKLKDHTVGDIPALMEYMDRLIQLKRKFQEGVRFNMTLLWDRIMAEWCLQQPHNCVLSL